VHQGVRLRRRDARARWEMHLGPSMTPMVDVVLVILIFFMASAALVGPERVLDALTPPERDAPADLPALPQVSFEIVLQREGSRTIATGLGIVGGGLDALDSAAARVGRELRGAEAVVHIDAHDAVPYADVVRARDVCARAGFERVSLR